MPENPYPLGSWDYNGIETFQIGKDIGTIFELLNAFETEDLC